MSTQKPARDLTREEYAEQLAEALAPVVQRIAELGAKLKPAIERIAQATAEAQSRTREEFTLVDGDEETP